MSASAVYFDGKLTRESFPACAQPSGPDAPPRKRLLLPQGELAQILAGGEPVEYLAALELREGAVRGNHFHRAKREFIYALHGGFTLVAEDLGTRERVELEVAAGDLVFIAPGVAHALRVTRPGWALEFTREPLDPTDSFRHSLV